MKETNHFGPREPRAVTDFCERHAAASFLGHVN
jgi:hypothetical protein